MSETKIPKGYKRTEVGVIPEEWEARTLGDLNPFVTSGSRGWAQYYSDLGSLFVRITNMSRDSIYLGLDNLKYVKLPNESSEGIRTQLQEHDVLISITADIGIVSYVDPQISRPAYINQHIALVRFDQSKTYGKFVSYFLASEKPQSLFRASTDTGAKAGMSLPTVRRIEIAYPPLPEQRAIATALSDVDALIVGLDQLIAKKRDLKQAAMQQLLTGQKRLPGFQGEWGLQPLALFSAFITKGSTPTTYGFDWEADGIRFLRSECVSEIGLDLGQAMFISTSAHSALIRGEVRSGDILITITGNVGRIVLLDSSFGIANINQHIARIRIIKPGLIPEFVYHFLSQPEIRKYYGTITTGQAYPQISLKQVRDTKISVPTVQEQTAIATILSDMDTELTALEQRRDKTRALKQGMMQELLTGKTRLI